MSLTDQPPYQLPYQPPYLKVVSNKGEYDNDRHCDGGGGDDGEGILKLVRSLSNFFADGLPHADRIEAKGTARARRRHVQDAGGREKKEHQRRLDMLFESRRNGPQDRDGGTYRILGGGKKSGKSFNYLLGV